MSDFPTKDNPQLCKNECGAKIYLKKTDKVNPKTGNPIWKPFNLDDTVHSCEKKQPTNNNNHNEISLELVLKKLASIGITIDLEKLRNCQ